MKVGRIEFGPKDTKQVDPATLASLKAAIQRGDVIIGNSAEQARRPEQERTATVEVFDHETAAGMIISWSEKGTGFGQITIAGNKETGEWTVDTETMRPSTCARFFRVIEERMRG